MVKRDMPMLAILLLLVLAGCAVPQQQTSLGFVPITGRDKIIVMRPDIAVDILTTGGMLERREDWTITARENVIASLVAIQARRGAARRITITRTAPAADDAILTELNKLHEVVGQSVMLHKFSPSVLPTKQGVFDWTLGELAVKYGQQTGHDYALFLYARDSFSSGGRLALQAVGFLSCAVGVCATQSGGSQTAFASLVDLKTGDLVWFNYIQSKEGDIRTQDGADVLVWTLLDSMSAAKKGS